MRILFIAIVTLVGTVGLLSLNQALGADKIVPATDAPKPLTPMSSRATFKLPEGFRIELVAAEPMLAEPTGMCFDAKGRLFVCELHGYNREGYYDILELNKTGVLDKAVRRIPARKEAEERAAKETYGTVRMLEDTKGNGQFDRMTVFADHLPPCYGVIAAGDGVIVMCAPHIVFLADRDGDGKAEIQEKLFTGFGVGEMWTQISNPRWGIDNWIYAASGASSRGTITGPRLKGAVKLGNTGFRFKADGSRLEPVSGGTAGFGLAFDDWGDRFLVTNQQHALFVAPLAYQGLARNPYYAAVNPIVNISAYGHPAKLFPTSQPDPWRRRRGEQKEWVKFYGSSETSAGLYTSACAPFIYQADLFPAEYRGNHFSCEPAQNLIHRCLLETKGAGFVAKRAEEGKEFLTSTDGWFRPVSLSAGPEGAIYVVDMYREIIEDYSAIPRYLQQQYVEGLKNGFDKGRIWRILAGNGPAERNANLAKLDTKALVAELNSPNVWRRLTAQRLLVERNDRQAIPALVKLCGNAATPQARLHAVYTLDGLGALTPALVQRALGDAHYGVRTNAVRLAERRLDREPALLAKATALTKDAHPKVRLQLAFSLGESTSTEALAALTRLARRDGTDRWMQAAILSAVPTRSALLAKALLPRQNAQDVSGALLKPLAAVTGARNQPEEIADLLQAMALLKGEDAQAAQVTVLTGLLEGLARSQARPIVSADERIALEDLLANSARAVKLLALRAAGKLGLKDSAAVTAARAGALRVALDDDKPLAQRKDALSWLIGASPTEAESLRQLLSPRQAIDLELEAVQVLASMESPDVVPILLKDWKAHSPRLQSAIIDVLSGRQDRLLLLLKAMEAKVVEPSSLPPARQTQLLDNPNKEIRARATKLLASRPTSAERQKVIERYRESLTLKRDTKRGKVVFETQCLQCHQLQGSGFAVGPDLAAVQNRPDASLLIDILDPSSTITVGFKTYLIVTKDGKVFTGTLAEETATSVTLRREKGEQAVILRRDIDEMAATSKSLMPDGLEKEISPPDMANLIGYLREALGPSVRKNSTARQDDLVGYELLVATFRTGDTEIFIVDPHSGDARNLTRSPKSQQRYPSWSPDGQLVAFNSNRDGTHNLYVIGADGKNLRQLTKEKRGVEAGMQSWTADGKWIYFGMFGKGKPRMCRIAPGGSDFHEVGKGIDPAVSPDGKTIVFAQSLPDGHHLCAMDADGSNVRQLTSKGNVFAGVHAAWSPDGKTIVYADQVGEALEIFRMDPDGKNAQQLTKLGKAATTPAVSPDGKWISFRLCDEIYWRDGKTSERTYRERRADKRPVWIMGMDGSNPHVIEPLHYQTTIDGSRAPFRPK